MRLLKTQLYRFVQRRRYRNILNSVPTRSIKVVWRKSFPPTHPQEERLLFVPENLPSLKSCQKSGSWVQSSMLFSRKYRWTSQPRPYFPKFPQLREVLTVNDNLVKSVELLKVSNCYVKRDALASKSLNIYQSKIAIRGSGYGIPSAILLDISGGESFQHFVQDALPVLALLKEVSPALNKIPILLPEPSLSFKSSQSYLEELEIQNPIKYMDENTSFHVEELYLFNFKPFNAIYGLSAYQYLHAYRRLHQEKVESESDRTVLLIERRERIRNFKDFELVKRKISDWAKKFDLDFETLDTSSADFPRIKEHFRKAKFIFAIHGGANYNIIWSLPDTTLIEFVPTVATDTVLPLAFNFGMSYLPYALSHDKGDSEYEIGEEDLNLIFKTLELSNMQFDSKR